MSYAVKEIFWSIQGEGFHAGRPAVFLRFAGCNLWDGREESRSSAACPFCDTDFLGGARYATADELADAALAHWPGPTRDSWCVLTGGEPALQADEELIDCLQQRGFLVAIETNGTRPVPPYRDWLTVSPKAGAGLVVRAGDELKVVWPQEGLDLAALRLLAFRHFYLQPKDGPDREASVRACLDYVRAHPRWRLSLQAHKQLGLR